MPLPLSLCNLYPLALLWLPGPWYILQPSRCWTVRSWVLCGWVAGWLGSWVAELSEAGGRLCSVSGK